jgi:acetone carboxylase, gamma subunit
MSTILHVGDNLDLDLDAERWLCGKCGNDLGAAQDNVKRGMLVAERDPSEIHPPMIDADYTFSPNPEWVRILEFYCPGCGLQMETEYLPPGHPITHTTDIDVKALKSRLANSEIVIEEGRMRLAGESGS